MDGLPYIISSYYYLPISISNDTLCLPTFSHCALCFLGQTFHWFLAKMPFFQREAALPFLHHQLSLSGSLLTVRSMLELPSLIFSSILQLKDVT
jgi:hypothetical protein